MYSNQRIEVVCFGKPTGKYASLVVPDEYLAATPELLREICNGCGSAGAKFDFVPDTIYGLNINPACDPHDWEYHYGVSEEDKKRGDGLFYTNMLRLIEAQGGLLEWPRKRRALKYYMAVKHLGHEAFYSEDDLIELEDTAP